MAYPTSPPTEVQLGPQRASSSQRSFGCSVSSRPTRWLPAWKVAADLPRKPRPPGCCGSRPAPAACPSGTAPVGGWASDWGVTVLTSDQIWAPELAADCPCRALRLTDTAQRSRLVEAVIHATSNNHCLLEVVNRFCKHPRPVPAPAASDSAQSNSLATPWVPGDYMSAQRRPP